MLSKHLLLLLLLHLLLLKELLVLHLLHEHLLLVTRPTRAHGLVLRVQQSGTMLERLG